MRDASLLIIDVDCISSSSGGGRRRSSTQDQRSREWLKSNVKYIYQVGKKNEVYSHIYKLFQTNVMITELSFQNNNNENISRESMYLIKGNPAIDGWNQPNPISLSLSIIDSSFDQIAPCVCETSWRHERFEVV